MNIKKRPNHELYIKVLRQMTPEAKVRKSFELSELSRNLFFNGLKKRFPDFSDEQIKNIYLDRIDKCHNSNY